MSALTQLLGPEVLEHVQHLERAFLQKRDFTRASSHGSLAKVDVDVLQVGAGPAVIHAIHLAQRGLKVAVADRRRLGCAHREWNISEAELQPLVARHILTPEQLSGAVVAAYREGIVHWHGGTRYAVKNVLDRALDAHALMAHLRTRALETGVGLLEEHQWRGITTHRNGVVAHFQTAHGPLDVSARLILDATGSSSPFADFDLACPTVGGVFRGLTEGDAPNEVDHGVGEILVSTEGMEEGRQHIWEGFPARGGEYTVYLFHYAQPQDLGPRPLTELYERFMRTRASYKRGDAQFLRPTYGIIPGHTRLGPAQLAPEDRILKVGDAAARQSPLTFCGFGSLVRSFGPTVDALVPLLEEDRLSRAHLARTWSDPPQLPLMGLLPLMMMDRGGFGADPAGINRLLDVAFGALAGLGPETFGRFVRDQADAQEVLQFMLAVGRRYPAVFRDAAVNLKPSETLKWAGLMGRAWLNHRGNRAPFLQPESIKAGR